MAGPISPAFAPARRVLVALLTACLALAWSEPFIQAEEPPVESDHLAIESVQGPDAGVSLPGQLGEAQVTFIGSIEQGRNCRWSTSVAPY